VELPVSSIGTNTHLVFHHYGPEKADKKIYIHAALHGDELPGLLVVNHLFHLLEKADKKQLIAGKISMLSFANPFGLAQSFLGTHQGRFNFATGVNFNRQFESVSRALVSRVEGKLTKDVKENVRMIREAFKEELDLRYSCDYVPRAAEEIMKYYLLREACDADVVLDLHSDDDAVMHLYTHDRLWPQLSDLAALLESECNMVDPDSGVNCFDESCSIPWSVLADEYPDYPIPMACQSVTIELRGEHDVYDSLAAMDAAALYQFLVHRGFVLPDTSPEGADDALPQVPNPFPKPIREATPLSGVDMIKCAVPGVLSWRARPGDVVEEGQLLGEIVRIDDPFAPRVPIHARTAGVIYGVNSRKMSTPGNVVMKIAGDKPLPWRTGNLLTSR